LRMIASIFFINVWLRNYIIVAFDGAKVKQILNIQSIMMPKWIKNFTKDT